ncbi:MAG: hypothetical protein N2483_00265 [Burkholderiaceae bacterium]|nr:hypothetical protein [Burkholderiaceae bacterium]
MIEVQDADLTGAKLSVQASATNGDNEAFTLTKVADGFYRLSGLPVRRGAPAVTVGNGRIDLVGASPPATTVTLTYLDQTPGAAPRPLPGKSRSR